MDKIQKIDDDILKIKKLKEKVPFGNSDFQIKTFISNDITPERCFRNVVLQLNQKIIALHEAKFRRERYLIDIDEAQDKLKKDNIDEYEKRRSEVLIAEKLFYLSNEEKLIDDCIRECNVYYSIIEKLPDIKNRDNFEASEQSYWTQRLQRDVINEIRVKGMVEKGTLESLNKLGIDIKKEADNIKFITIQNLKITGG